MTSTREVERFHLENLDLVMVVDCFGDHRIVEVNLPQSMALVNLKRLTNVERQTILHDLPRPFFRIDCPGRFLLTGIIGDPKVRFTLRQATLAKAREMVTQAIRELLNLNAQEAKR